MSLRDRSEPARSVDTSVTSTPEDPRSGPGGSDDGARSMVVLLVLAFTGVVVSIQQTVMVPLLPDLPRLLGTSVDNASWLITSTLVAGAVATPTLARLADMYGKKRMMLITLAITVVGSIIGALGDTLPVLIAARSLQGVGMALVPIGMAIMRDELPPRRVPLGVASMSATLAVGAGGGLPLAGVIAEHFEWQAIFWLTGLCGLVMLGCVALLVRESPVCTMGRFDYGGAVVLTGGLTLLLLALSKGAEWGWLSPWSLGASLVGALLLVLCVTVELRVQSPVVDVRAAARPAVLLVNLCALFAGFGMYINMLVSAQIMQAPAETGYGLGMGLGEVGLWMAPTALVFGATAPVAAVLMRRFSPLTVLVAGGVIMAGSYVARVFLSDNLAQVIVGALVVSAGTSLTYAAMPILIMRAVPPTESASAVGLNALLRVVGTSASSAAMAAVASMGVIRVDGGQYPGFVAMVTLFCAAAVLCLMATLVVLPLFRSEAGDT